MANKNRLPEIEDVVVDNLIPQNFKTPHYKI
jgi:hypothetical protein